MSDGGSVEVVARTAHAYKLVTIDSVTPFDRNPRTHSGKQITQIRESIRKFGFTNPLLIDEQGRLIAGHGRMIAAKAEGMTELPAIVVTGLSDVERQALVIVDNQLALNAGWDEKLLATNLIELKNAEFDMGMIGFTDIELEAYMAEEREEGSDGSMLALVNVTIDEPKTTVAPGDRWSLGNHTLICASVSDEWASWVPQLDTKMTLLCVFPGPFVLASDKAKTHRLVLVQPDIYIAGHIIDRYLELNGEGSATKVKSA